MDPASRDYVPDDHRQRAESAARHRLGTETWPVPLTRCATAVPASRRVLRARPRRGDTILGRVAS